MSDQERGRAFGPLSVIAIVLLVIIAMLATVSIMERSRARQEANAPAPVEKPVKLEPVTLELQYETAVHESGHALLNYAYLPDRPISQIWLYAEKREGDRLLGLTEPGDATACHFDGDWDRAIALFFLGGLAAEQVVLGKQPPEAYEDKDAAGEQTLKYCEAVGCDCPDDSKVGGQCLLKDMMRAERQRLYAEAVRCLTANKETVVTLANQLFRQGALSVPNDGARRVLGADDLRKFFAAHPLTPCGVAPSMP